MSLEEIEEELELAGLGFAERRMLLSAIKRSGFDPKAVDEKLKFMGFAPVFTIYDEEESQTQSKG